jgi:hypothetical protein
MRAESACCIYLISNTGKENFSFAFEGDLFPVYDQTAVSLVNGSSYTHLTVFQLIFVEDGDVFHRHSRLILSGKRRFE